MEAAFLKILNMSIMASWVVLAVIAVRFLMKKAPKWVTVLLWGLVGIRLICPLSPESVFSLIPSAETVPGDILYTKAPEIHSGVASFNAAVNPIISEHLAPSDLTSVNPTQVIAFIASIIWILGIAAMLIYTAVSYFRIHRKVREAVIFRENILLCDHVDTPFILGVFRPRIFLPSAMSEQDMEYVIAHEKAHLKRRDHLWKPLGFLLLTVYWFNPLIWIAYILLCRDIEYACDEKVIRDMGDDNKKPYSNVLINCSVPRRTVAACPLAFGEVGVKGRVKSVLNYKKPAFWIIIIAVIACAVVAVCFLTNPLGFSFDEASNAIVSASCFDVRSADDAGVVELSPAQISELSSRLGGVKNTKRGDMYAGLTPGYQISALLKDGTYIKISGYSLSDTDKVDIEWKENRYVVSDSDFREYLSRICAGRDVFQSVNVTTLREQYPEYFGLDASNGLDVYVWQMAENSYSFGLLPHTEVQRDWLSSELLSLRGTDAEEMRQILSTYDIDESNISIIPWQNPVSSYIGDYWILFDGENSEEKQSAYIEAVRDMLFGEREEMPVYDSAIFDIDGDGKNEVCVLGYGRTSGLFTFTFSASEEGDDKPKYNNVFCTEWYDLSFVQCEDGVVRVQGIDQAEVPQTHLFDIAVIDGNIHLTEDGQDIRVLIPTETQRKQ